MLFGFGCERIEGHSSETVLLALPKKETSSPDTMSMDLGILFADREQSFCFPITKLGITRADQIRSVFSSCDCIVVKLREYTEPDGQAAVALDIHHAKSQDGPNPTIRLNVQLALETSMGNGKRIEMFFTLAKGWNSQ